MKSRNMRSSLFRHPNCGINMFLFSVLILVCRISKLNGYMVKNRSHTGLVERIFTQQQHDQRSRNDNRNTSLLWLSLQRSSQYENDKIMLQQPLVVTNSIFRTQQQLQCKRRFLLQRRQQMEPNMETESVTAVTDSLKSSVPTPPITTSNNNPTTLPLSSSTTTAQEQKQVEEPEQPFPIDLPSPILLASSMILAIAATGSLSQLATSGNDPTTNSLPMLAGITLIGYPLCIYLLIAAIQKAKYETEEDDKAFLSGKK